MDRLWGGKINPVYNDSSHESWRLLIDVFLIRNGTSLGDFFVTAKTNWEKWEGGDKFGEGKFKNKPAISVYSKTFELSLSDILGQTLF